MSRSFTLLLLVAVSACQAFSYHPERSALRQVRTTADSTRPYDYSMSTVIEPPTKEDIFEKTRRGGGDGDLLGDKEGNFDDALRKQGPIEWLEDPEVSREMEDPFHILLLDQTYEKEKITVEYVASSLNYVLVMPMDEATELSQFAYDEGMSCLGTWPREECLDLGRQLQVRDLVCRVVPFCDGGQRGWQAKEGESADVSSFRDANYE